MFIFLLYVVALFWLKNWAKTSDSLRKRGVTFAGKNENILNFYKYIDNIEVTTYNKTIDRVSIFGRAPANKWRILNSGELLPISGGF